MRTIRVHGKYCRIHITIEQLIALADKTTNCPLCSISFEQWGSEKSFSQPSLDRKDNARYLSLDNIWVICSRCNLTKRDRTFKEFVEYCKQISDNWYDKIREEDFKTLQEDYDLIYGPSNPDDPLGEIPSVEATT